MVKVNPGILLESLTTNFRTICGSHHPLDLESKQHKNETEESLLCIMPIDLHTSSTGLPKLTAALQKKKKKIILKSQWKEHAFRVQIAGLESRLNTY